MRLNAHQKPHDDLKALYKRYQKVSGSTLAQDETVIDFERGLSLAQRAIFEVRAFNHHEADSGHHPISDDLEAIDGLPTNVFTCKTLPGLVVIPSLLSTDEQRRLVQKLVHRDLSNPQHMTNVHFHHGLVYPQDGGSFFDFNPDDESKIQPKTAEHKAISMRKFFSKKLRWMTLGGQYDWTNKVYPSEAPPPFPADLQAMLCRFFPNTTAEAAIVNFYSPGDVLSLHRDVAEYCDKGLISLSIGCDGLFMVALDRGNEHAAENLILRLRSGDAVYMDGESRYAWHGVPVVLADTCPQELQAFPATEGKDSTGDVRAHWKYWMRSKRINLNVRQMWADNDGPLPNMPASAPS